MIFSLLWKLFERGGYALVQMAVQIVMARLLAPEQFGALAIMLVFVNLGNVVVQSGLNTALIQTKDASEEDYSTVFWLSFAISLALYAVVFTVAPTVAAFYAMPELIWPLRSLALILMVNAYNAVQIAAITRELDMRKIFRATLISAAVSATCGIGCALAGMGLWALVVQQLSFQISNCAAHAAQLSWRPRFTFNARRAGELFSFGSRLLASGLLDQAYQSLSDMIIGKQFSAASLGLVSQGKKYPNAIGNMLDGAIQPVMLSVVSRVQSDRARVKAIVRRALKTSTFLVVPAMSLFALVAPTLVPLVLGGQWRESVPFLQVYCIVYAMLPIHTTNLQALNGMGRSDLFLKLELVKKAYGIAWILFAAFVMRDIHLMVFGYLVTGLVSTIVNSWPNRRVIGYAYGEQVRDIMPAVGLTLAACCVAWAIAAWVPLFGWTLVFAQIVVFSAIYLGLAAAFRIEAFTYLVSNVRSLMGARGR